MAFAGWARQQVRGLRLLGFQVADKDLARVRVELFNSGLVEAGLVVVGTLAYGAWLNEMGVKAVAARPARKIWMLLVGMRSSLPRPFRF